MRRLTIAILVTLLGVQMLARTVGAEPPMLPGMDEMMRQMEADLMELHGLSSKDLRSHTCR